ncbi:hypothetical protein [Paracoccus actinidiae]|uniref:hypothetical protein n=1 Tax=Paracoccus actinidiae TaxID=3064531 RepID=UPI0027D26956|nr:hypothetical protein [Paracoccus sp. M09]
MIGAIRLPALTAVMVCAAFGAYGDPEIDELPRSTSQFSYYQLGRHVPVRSGWSNYIGGRTVVHGTMHLPLEIDPAAHSASNPQHMYCNTQVWGFDDDGEPTGKSNHIRNYSFPWTSTFCESRDFAGTADQLTEACGSGADGRLRKSHQGSDCRPPTPDADRYWMVAVEPGTVVKARHNLVEVVGDSGIKWKYRHGGTPRAEIMPQNGRGVRVAVGDRLAQVTDLSSTSIHLHLESERPAGTDRDNLPSLVLAYERALGVNQTPIGTDGALAFDGRFEIAEGAAAQPCALAENETPLDPGGVVAFASFWCHNGSIMGLVENGNRLQFIYHKPRPGIRSVAVRRPVLVEATRNSSAWSGAATWYNSRCGDRLFDISGRASQIDNVPHVTLSGRRPSFTAACATPHFLDETLIFSFIRDGAGAAPVPDVGVLVPEYGVRVSGDCDAVAGAVPVDGFAEFDVISLWCHNGSLMGLVAEGSERQIVYIKPQGSLRPSVARNRILVHASLEGGRYTGRALQFNSNCGDPTFEVTGQEVLIDGTRTIKLVGARSVLRPNCSVQSTRTETLNFTLVASIGDGQGNRPVAESACVRTATLEPVMPEAAITVSSLWCADNSVVGMAEDGASRKIYYYKPVEGLRDMVTRQPILFDGSVESGSYRGKILWPEPMCGASESPVDGFEVTSGGVPAITLRGRRHAAGQSCSEEPGPFALTLSFRGSEQVSFGGEPQSDAAPICRTDSATIALRGVLSRANILQFSPSAKPELIEALICHAGLLVDQNITPGLRLAHFMTQVATETGGMRTIEENLNYTAQRLREVFPNRVTAAQAQALAHKPLQIANHVYGNRRDLENGGPDDGWNYRGSGFLQLTGRGNFRDRGLEIGLPLEANPDLARKPTEGLQAATAYWSSRSINRPADDDDVEKVRRLVNGGTNGLAEARLWLPKAKAAFGGRVSEDDDADARQAVVEILIARGALDPGFGTVSPSEAELSTGLDAYQQLMNLPETGRLDNDTFNSLVDPEGWRERR